MSSYFYCQLVESALLFGVNVKAFHSYINSPIQLGSCLRHKWPARCCETQMQILNMNYRGCICPLLPPVSHPLNSSQILSSLGSTKTDCSVIEAACQSCLPVRL